MPNVRANGIDIEYESTAKAIPEAELLVIPGMGHDLPEALWATLAAAAAANASRAA